jgi:4a-hydroxytetrahydrobiopterin dehydratase
MLNIEEEISQLSNGWETNENKSLRKTYQFKGFLKTMSFVNAVAWEANRIMHHPDMEISFNKCIINLTTHDDGNTLTEKDFQLAKNIDGLLNAL